MKPLVFPSILLMGLFVFSGILPEVTSAGGGSAGFHSSFNRGSGFKSRIDSKFQSSFQRRTRIQQGFRDGRASSFRGSRRQGVSPLRRNFLFGPNELRNRLDENSRKIQNDVIRGRQDFLPRHPGFKIKPGDTRRLGKKRFVGRDFVVGIPDNRRFPFGRSSGTDLRDRFHLSDPSSRSCFLRVSAFFGFRWVPPPTSPRFPGAAILPSASWTGRRESDSKPGSAIRLCGMLWGRMTLRRMKARNQAAGNAVPITT
ncbi:exported hypothetical protein [Nitrospina gracilis 3/211]|uniref:Uncharacterized protein n=1 Tax=Nitrospina gracilis (strain 3/211) TaxID=1266370 RepID=M1YFL2_NITG3|nr:exported hypothetical protein [Nitrospina gracilis 3/211]